MGGGSAPQSESTASMLKAYSQYLPGLVSSTAAQEPTIAQNQLNATLATQPLYNALNLQQTQQYALPLARVGQEVARSNALAGARTNLEQMQGPGTEAALTAEALNRAANPNYYAVQDAASQRARQMLNAIDLSGRLGGGEQAAIERSLNQQNQMTGNLGLNNPMNTVSNAMMFGNAAYQRQQQALQNMSGALGTANQVAQSAVNSGFNPVNIALGQPNVSTMGNFGTGQFTNVTPQTQQGAGQQAFGFGQGLMGNMFSQNAAAMQAQAQAGAGQGAMMGAGIGAAGGIAAAAL